MPDVATFDGATKVIQLTDAPVGGESRVNAYDIYSSWARWMTTGANQVWYEAFSQSGGELIGPGKTTGVRVFVLNGWLIRPYEADHRLVLDNYIAGENDVNIITTTVGDYAVAVQYSVPADAIGIDTSGIPAPTAAENAAAVWSSLTTSAWVEGSFGWLVKQMLTVAKFLGLK